MVGTLDDLTADVLTYTTYDDPDFIAQIPAFIREAEERTFYFVQLPYFRKLDSSLTCTIGNPQLAVPEDFMAPASLAVVLVSGDYEYLLNKDVNFIRAVFPNPTTRGTPSHYAILEADQDATTLLLGKTPDLAYQAVLEYFYRPPSLTLDDNAANTTWLSLNAYDTLLYGTLDEAAVWMKKNAGIDNMGDTYSQRFAIALQGLKNLGESRDRKDTYRSGEKRKPE